MEKTPFVILQRKGFVLVTFYFSQAQPSLSLSSFAEYAECPFFTPLGYFLFSSLQFLNVSFASTSAFNDVNENTNVAVNKVKNTFFTITPPYG